MTDTQAPPDAADLAALLAQGRFMFLRMAQALLDADLAIAGWKPDAVQSALACMNQGARIGIEIFADDSGAATVALVAVSPAGERHELGRVTEGARGAVN